MGWFPIATVKSINLACDIYWKLDYELISQKNFKMKQIMYVKIEEKPNFHSSYLYGCENLIFTYNGLVNGSFLCHILFNVSV